MATAAEKTKSAKLIDSSSAAADAPLTAQVASVQASLLYTTSSGERRIRVHTLVAPVSSDLGQIADSADVDALANVFGGVLQTAVSGRWPRCRRDPKS